MTTITIQLSDKALRSLEMAAKQEGTSVEKIVEATLEKVVETESIDHSDKEKFEEAMRYVLNKNAELYKRLA